MYRVEICDGYTAEFKDAFATAPFDLVDDYLSPQPCTISVTRHVNAELYNTVAIRDYEKGTLLHRGFISDIESTDDGDTLTILSPVMWFNNIAYQEAGNYTWGESIRRQIFADYEAENCIIKKLPIEYRSASPWENWGDYPTAYGREIMKTTDAIIKAAKAQGLFMLFSFGTGKDNLGKIYYGFQKPFEPITLEIDLPFITNKSIQNTAKGAANIAILYVTTGGYYQAIRVDGAIYYKFEMSIEDFYRQKNKIILPRVASQVIEPGTSIDDIKQKLAQMLPAEDDGYTISITMSTVPQILNGLITIGRLFILKNGEKTYRAYLTAITRNADGSITLVFGMARQNLTQILNSKGI